VYIEEQGIGRRGVSYQPRRGWPSRLRPSLVAAILFALGVSICLASPGSRFSDHRSQTSATGNSFAAECRQDSWYKTANHRGFVCSATIFLKSNPSLSKVHSVYGIGSDSNSQMGLAGNLTSRLLPRDSREISTIRS
jgi:hypothetical protein